MNSFWASGELSGVVGLSELELPPPVVLVPALVVPALVVPAAEAVVVLVVVFDDPPQPVTAIAAMASVGSNGKAHLLSMFLLQN